MKGTTGLILGALLVAGLSLALACCGTLDLQIEAAPGAPATLTPPAPTATYPAPGQQDLFSASRAALADYDPLQDAARMVDTLSQECALWLSAGHDPAALPDALRTLPGLASADVEVTAADLNGDGLSDVLIEPRFPGLSLLACLAREGERYACRPLPGPEAFGVQGLTMRSSVDSPDLTGDGRTDGGRAPTSPRRTDSGGSPTRARPPFGWPGMRRR
jgi:hypothetical protein